MIVVSRQLDRAAVVDLLSGAIAAFSAAVLIYFRTNSAWLIFAGGLAGFARTRWFVPDEATLKNPQLRSTG
jgi:chromate transporter